MLIDDHRRKMQRQRLGEHVAGLWHRAFGGVDQQQDAVDHGQGPLDLAAEVGVTRRVDQVDPGALPLDRGGLGEDGDTALALLIVGVHDAVDLRLVGREDAGRRSMASTSVVLPWSTCAINATLRKEEADMGLQW